MTNDEIRIRIAKGLGWRYDGRLFVPPEGDKRRAWCAEWDENGLPNWLDNWPTDDAAALALLTGPVVDAGLEWIIESQRGTTWCKIVDGDHIISMGIQDTVAAAICAAVLAWMDKRGESNMDPPVEDK